MKLPWFKLIGLFFVPRNLAGWLILMIGIAYSVYNFIEIDKKSHSASDTLINFFFRMIIIVAIYYIIAFLTFESSKDRKI